MLRTVKRALAIAVVGLGLGLAAPAGAAPDICLSNLSENCVVRPDFIGTGAHTYLRAVRWRSWNGNTAIGYGRLIETGGCCGPHFNDPAKIRLGLPAECGNRIWYSRMWVSFGRGFHRRYLHGEERWPCNRY